MSTTAGLALATDLEGPEARERHARVLREASLRVTTPRLAVLAAVENAPHADADRILTRVRATSRVSRQAVFDVLNALTAAGVLRRIEPAGSPALYETRTGDNHHHLVCRGCGDVTDVDCVPGTPPCLDAPDASGYVIDEAEVTYWGWCPTCAQARSHTEEN